MSAAAEAVVVEARNPGIAEGAQAGTKAWGLADGLEHSDARIVDASAAALPSGGGGIERHESGHRIDEMIGESAANPAVWIGQAAVQPKARRFDGAAGKNDHAGILTVDNAAIAFAPGDALCHRTLIDMQLHDESVGDQRDRSAPLGPAVARQGHRDV